MPTFDSHTATASMLLSRRCAAARTRGGFTLVELAACVAIMAILAAAAAVSLHRHRDDATFPAAVQVVRSADEQIRHRALRSGGPAELRIDLDHPDVIVITAGDKTSEFRLPHGFRISRASVSGRPVETGEWSLHVSPRGWAPAYGIEVATGATRKWVFFTALTGDVHTSDDEQLATHIEPPAR